MGEERIKILSNLKRRVKITYKTRINAAERLRQRHNHYKSLNIYYSALVTALSIASIGGEQKIGNLSLSNLVLIYSIVLSYFMFYIAEQNLQERAYKMEETFKKLDKLRNKISVNLNYKQEDEISESECEKLYKEYETIIESIENHEPIDYDIYRLSELEKKDSNLELYKEIEKRVKRYKIINKLKIRLKYIVPTIITIITLYIAIKK